MFWIVICKNQSLMKINMDHLCRTWLSVTHLTRIWRGQCACMCGNEWLIAQSLHTWLNFGYKSQMRSVLSSCFLSSWCDLLDVNKARLPHLSITSVALKRWHNFIIADKAHAPGCWEQPQSGRLDSPDWTRHDHVRSASRLQDTSCYQM